MVIHLSGSKMFQKVDQEVVVKFGKSKRMKT
jgi:hypothetical protein